MDNANLRAKDAKQSRAAAKRSGPQVIDKGLRRFVDEIRQVEMPLFAAFLPQNCRTCRQF